MIKPTPYISFAILAIGIEFLGKCLNTNENDWNKGRSDLNFKKAINELVAFEEYRDKLDKYELHDSLRNGFAHSFVPKGTISLSSKDEDENFKVTDGKLNLRCENLYKDFKNACIEVINMRFARNNKMNKPLLKVP